jgi:hypothetical protein
VNFYGLFRFTGQETRGKQAPGKGKKELPAMPVAGFRITAYSLVL